LDDPETVLKGSSASETKKDDETTPEANEETYTELDDDVAKAAKEDNLIDEDPFKTEAEHKERILAKSKSYCSQSGGFLLWGVILFGDDEDLDAESQSCESSCASEETRENWDAESGRATIIYESLPDGVREIYSYQGAYEDEHESLASERETQPEDASCSDSTRSSTSQISSKSVAVSIPTKLPDNEQLIVI
jgi:hypothetical protein